MSEQRPTTPEAARAAAYLAAKERLDLKGKVKCNPPNRACGDRCIPPNWKCRVKGEGTDSHSRVIAGDPLAGAASIARGRKRLAKGLRKGKVEEIQAGRAAIARGIVKAVPGKNIKQKQELRKTVETVILPVATGLFAAWALRQGHEAAKLLFPAYAQGPGKDIENAAGTTVGFVLDRIPIYGEKRRLERKIGNQRANMLANAATFGANNAAPSVPSADNTYFSKLSRSVSGASKAVNEGLTAVHPEKGIKPYDTFRSDLLSGVLGATIKGKGADGSDRVSAYAEPATIRFMSKQFGLDPATLKGGAYGEEQKNWLIDGVAQQLQKGREQLRADMAVRGLSYKKPEDVEKYVDIAVDNAKTTLGKAQKGKSEEAVADYRSMVRSLIKGGEAQSTKALADEMYVKTFNGFDNYFKTAAERVKDDTDARRQVGAAASRTSPVKDTLIGVAERIKTKVGMNSPIAGANHAELVIQKVYHEYSLTSKKKFARDINGNNTWTASDSTIRYAAQDLGWDGSGGTEGAYKHLRATGQFARLAWGNVSTATARPRSQNKQQRLGDLIRSVRKRKGNENLSMEQIIAIAKQELNRDDSDDMPVRVKAYLEMRLRQDKKCGASYISDKKKCTKANKGSNPKDDTEVFTKTLVASTALVGGVAVTATVASSIDDVVKERSRQFGEPTLSTFTGKIGNPDIYRKGVIRTLSSGHFGDTALSEVNNAMYVVKTPKQSPKSARVAAGAGLDSKARRNLYRSQGRITRSEVVNNTIAGDIGVAPKVVAANRNTLVAEHVKGQPLRKLDDKSLVALNESLGKLHRAGIAHNDLKPDNIFMNDKGKAVIIDFGLSSNSPGAVAGEWYRAMNSRSSNPLIGITKTATGSLNLKRLNPEGYKSAEKALSAVIGGKVSESRLTQATKDAKKARQIQLVINNYYAGKYNQNK